MCLLNLLFEVASDMDDEWDECREHALPPPALLTINIYAYPEHRDASLSGPGEAAADREHVAYCFR